ncbi:MAG: SH3 domain-containing protein [Anaerolineaceae bacterium]|nr:SH3 domain-containing protein [Anaerolineaceae bacterium]
MRRLRFFSPFLLIIGLIGFIGLAASTFAQETPTPAPIFVFTPVPSPTPGCAAPLSLTTGMTAYVRAGTYVRYGPDASSPYVNYYAEAVTVTITGGPVCDQNYNWWQVRGPGDDGWVAEGRPGAYWITPAGGGAAVVCGTSEVFTPGEKSRLLAGLRVRAEAGLSGLVLTVAPQGALVDILAGPVCANGYNWWQIQVPVVGVSYTGWVAEGQPGGATWLGPEVEPEVCAPPLPMHLGTQGYVNYKDMSPKHLRTGPTLSAATIVRLLDGIGFEVIGGPVCTDSYNWWQVRILTTDVTGWLAEGGPPNYWIQFRGGN